MFLLLLLLTCQLTLLLECIENVIGKFKLQVEDKRKRNFLLLLKVLTPLPGSLIELVFFEIHVFFLYHVDL